MRAGGRPNTRSRPRSSRTRVRATRASYSARGTRSPYMAKQAGEDPLVAAAFDKDRHGELARAVEQLTPDEAQFFLDKLERALRRRRLQFIGYLVAMLAWAAGMLVALAAYGLSADGHFMGWVFLAPFALVG